MSNADRIEELRNKYEENPRRYFAPLANEYRKAGDLAQAISICREHLPKQPGHMSGYIVYGQTLFEANNLEEARSVFEQALTLDPENLIALKHLGDIARMNGENSVARRWYSRVLDADPRNDDIASQLASLGAPTPVAPVPVIPVHMPLSEPQSHGEAVGVFATFDPNSLLDVPDDVTGITGGREFWAPAAPEQRPLPQHEPLDLDFPESPEPVAEEAFEEGIIAPEWPDTSELVARVTTPFHSATPISVPATPDTLAAFGREAFDSVDSAPADAAPADELVDAFLPPEPAARLIDVDEPVEFADHEFESAAFETSGYATNEFEAAHAETSEYVAAEVSSADVVSPAHAESVVEFIDEHVASVAEPVVESVVANDAIEDDLVAAHVVANETDAFDLIANNVVESEAVVDEPISESDAQVVEQLADDELVWADSVVPNSETPQASVAAQVVDSGDETPAEPDDTALGETLPWLAGTNGEMDVLPTDVTAEYEVPEQFKSGVHAAFAEAEHVAEEPAFDLTAFETPVVDDVHEEPIASAVVEHAAEESFAEVASQLEAEKAAPFVTETMAELLVAQGFLPRAIEVYDELVRRRPHDPVLVSRLSELRALHEAEELPTTESSATETFANESIASAATPHFNTPIRNTPLYMTPQYNTPQYSTPTHNTPHFSTLSATPALVPSFAETNATSSNVSERHVNDRAQAFRTARERFAELSRRRVARRTPTHATAVADDAVEGLSSLFGTAVPTTTDELAARALADAFGPVQDSGESLFDPVPTPTPALPMRSLTPRSTTPVYTPATPDPRAQGTDRQPSADYSFDRFFPDPAMAGREGQSAQSTIPVSSSSQPVNEDLAQFSAWLKGLNNA